ENSERALPAAQQDRRMALVRGDDQQLLEKPCCRGFSRELFRCDGAAPHGGRTPGYLGSGARAESDVKSGPTTGRHPPGVEESSVRRKLFRRASRPQGRHFLLSLSCRSV